MTDPENTQEKMNVEEPEKSKRGLVVSSSIFCVIAAASMTAFLGVPTPVSWDYSRFVVPLKAEAFEVNLADASRRRYLVMDLVVDVRSYNEEATRSWVSDPICVSPDGVQGKLFMEQIRSSVEKVIFAVQFGDAMDPMNADSDSGLGPGVSSRLSTFRGPISKHSIYLDCIAHTVQFDDGAA